MEERLGNTNFILETLSEKIENSELLLLKEKRIEYCKGCLICHQLNRCIINDDINDIIDKLIDYDLLIFGVPNYFDNVSGLFKNFIDRLHPLYKSGRLANKKVIFIYVGGGREEGTKNELHQATKGFIKYLKLNLIEEYSFKALNLQDMLNQEEKIQNMLKEIKNIIDEL